MNATYVIIPYSLSPSVCLSLMHINNKDDETSATAMMEKPIKLVAFSKGGLVLNHILAELATTIKLRKNIAAGHSQDETMLDWEAEYMASLLPNYEPSQRIGCYRYQFVSIVR